jgi:cell wall-associated NlpC family hydrolase
VLSATRRRVLPASLLVTGALGASVLMATVPAQATTATSVATTSVATTSVATTSVAATSTVTTSVAGSSLATSVTVPAAALTPAQVVAAAAARAAAARRAAAFRAAARVMRIRTTAVHIARTELGARYAAGRVGPRAFDCSGLAIYVVKKATGRSLPHYSKAQFSVTKRVSRANLRPGDLVFFFRHGTHHVGIYIGGGRMISATNPRGGVRVDSVFTGWYGSRYSGAGRLV